MKKLFFTLLAVASFGLSRAQLSLTRSFTPQDRTHYFELVNNSSAPTSLNLRCYSLLSYFRNSTGSGFYVINLPDRVLDGNGVLTIGSDGEGIQTTNTKLVQLNWNQLYHDGQLQRYLISDIGTGFTTDQTRWNQTAVQPFSSDGFVDHMVLLFNGSTLVDASVTQDQFNNLPDFVARLSDLSFTNGCGNTVAVRFGALKSMYPNIFSRQQQDDLAYFQGFDIQRNNAQVQIAWNTIREDRNRGFEIERRIGNDGWTTVAYVATLAPQGRSSQTLSYLYGDNLPNGATVQYRLKQIDLNGRATYSPVKTINTFGQQDRLVVYPNPSTDGRASIAFGNVNSLRDVQVLDINGQVLQQWISVNNNTQQVNNLRSGQYFVRVRDHQTGAVYTEKLLVAAR